MKAVCCCFSSHCNTEEADALGQALRHGGLNVAHSPQNPDRYEQIISEIQPDDAVVGWTAIPQNTREMTREFSQFSVWQRHSGSRFRPAVINHGCSVSVQWSSNGYKLLQRLRSHPDDVSGTKCASCDASQTLATHIVIKKLVNSGWAEFVYARKRNTVVE